MTDQTASGGSGGEPFSQLLRNPYEAFLREIHDSLAAAGYADSYPSWGTNVFHYLREGGLRLTDLAGRTHTTKQAMLYVVNRLEEAGYVERVPDPVDGRASIIRLTERGWEVRRVADDIMARMEDECTRRLGEQRMRQFKELTVEVSRVLEEYQERG
ncbi:MAG: MarR family winged helix-turn-helix transcriptional regulator [Rubrobacteraceae bacterium]